MERLKSIGAIPINKSILYSLYSELKRPDAKVSELERKGLVIRVKRDLYVVSPKVHNQEISRELVANHLYSPSYVSLETALAWYGLIPERVYSVRSVCTKMHKNYDTPLGNFEFIKVPSVYYPIGIRQEIVDNRYAFLIASPEKALCDKIVCSPNVRIQSVKAMREYLENDLRFEMSELQDFDIEIIRKCAEVGRKKTGLGMLEKLLLVLQKNIFDTIYN